MAKKQRAKKKARKKSKRKAVRRNPPASKPAKKKRRKRSGGGCVAVFDFGTPESLIYKRKSDGKRYRHKFGRGARILVPKTGAKANWLAIRGVKVTGYIEG